MIDTPTNDLPSDYYQNFQLWKNSKLLAHFSASKITYTPSDAYLDDDHLTLQVGSHSFQYELNPITKDSIDWKSDFAKSGWVGHRSEANTPLPRFYGKLNSPHRYVDVRASYHVVRAYEEVLRDMTCFWDVIHIHWEKTP